nr:hypothetical protein [Tanacetum cinerariifolium]
LYVTTKGKQPTRATTPTEPTDVERTEAKQLKIVLRRSRQETHISQHGGSSTDEGTGNDEEDQDLRLSEEARIQEEEDADELYRDEDQDLRLSEEARIQEEEEADELYRDVDINQGRGLQVSQNIEDSHVTLTLVHLDGLQESSSVSSFVTSMLNPIIDAGVESIFTTASSPNVSLQTPTPIMTPSTIATITKSSDAPIPPTTIPRTILENLPTFDSVFRFDERLKSLETTFSEYRQTNPFVDAVSAILDEQQNLYKALLEAYDADKTILDTYGESTILKRRQEDDDQEGPSAIGSAGRSTTGSQSRQLSASESAFVKEPVQTTCQMKEPSHPVFETGAKDQPIVQTS